MKIGWNSSVQRICRGLRSIKSNKNCKKINVKKAPGPNDPILKILKNFAKYFAIPLTEIFNESFQWKIFPKAWKEYKVLGIPKSVPCTLVEDLRLIALSSVVAKAQEYDDTVGKISDSQYGGLPQSSTINALVNLIHKWHKSMDWIVKE